MFLDFDDALFVDKVLKLKFSAGDFASQSLLYKSLPSPPSNHY